MIEEARRNKLMKTKIVIANRHTDKHAQSFTCTCIFQFGVTQNSLLRAMFQEFSVGKLGN